MRHLLLLGTGLVLAVAGVSCGRGPGPSDHAGAVAAIYPLAAASGAGDQCGSGLLLILDRTGTPGCLASWDDIRRTWPALERDTWDRFLEANASPQPLAASLALGREYKLVSPDEIGVLDAQPVPFAQAVSTRHPGASGYMVLSRVGLNTAGNQALVYLYCYCGQECARGDLCFLRKAGSGWTVAGCRRLMVA